MNKLYYGDNLDILRKFIKDDRRLALGKGSVFLSAKFHNVNVWASGDCMTEIFVEVRGGVLVETYSNNREVIVRVIDWDNFGDDHETTLAGTIPCQSLDRMPEETLAATGLKPQI